MRYYVGLDLSLDSTHICVLDEGGAVVNRAITPTDPASIADHLMGLGRRVSRVGFEMTATAAWIYEGLSQRGLPAICIEARHAHGILKNNINKTDRNDARGIAELMRIGVFRNVHIKTREAQEFRTLLTTRKLLQIKVIDLENGIGGILRAFGLKVRRVRQDAFQAQVETLAAGSPMLLEMVGHLLAARATLRAHFDELDRRVTQVARADETCRRLMTAPGIGPIGALTYRVVIDVPSRFRRSRTVGAHVGLTSRADQSGKHRVNGRISRWGDKALRASLYSGASTILMPRTGPSRLRDWGLNLVATRGRKRATVAVARRLAVILHRMWLDGKDFDDKKPAGSPSP